MLGLIVTVAACSGVTVTGTEALLPSAVAEIVAVPTATASTFPSAVTVATAELLDENDTRLLRMVLPSQLKAVPTIVEAAFTGSVNVAGATVTEQAVGGFRPSQPTVPPKAISSNAVPTRRAL
ncbi:hypothetical protein MASR1M101_17800 [Gemmatimonas sp.]